MSYSLNHYWNEHFAAAYHCKLTACKNGTRSLFALCIFNVNLWLTGLDIVVHSSCLMTISRSLQFFCKIITKIIKINKYVHKYLTNICGRVFMDHYALCMMIMASIFLSGLGWVGLFCRLVSWVGLGPLATGLGWVGSQKMDPRPCLI